VSAPAPGSTNDPIRQFLAAVRARLRRRQAWGGATSFVAVTMAAALGLLLLAALVGPSTAWRPLALVGVTVAAALAAIAAARALRSFGSDDAVARFVGGRLPALGGDLLSAVELERELPKLEQDPILSPALVEALRRKVADRLADVRPHGLVDMRPLRRQSFRRLAAVASGYLLVVWLWPGALRRGWAELESTRPDHVATSAEPIVGDLRLELRYPPYTGLAPRVIPSSSGQVLALPGTTVKLAARALVPIAEAQLVIDEDGRDAPEVRPVEVRGRELESSFTVRKPGSYRLVVSGAGRRVREPEAHRIDVEPDRPPRVDLYAPSESLEVAGPRRVELGWSVDDDYGLGEIQLVWKAGTQPEARRTIAAPPPAGSRSSAGKFEWDLAELDLKAGVRVAYHLEAKDNDVVSGPNVGVSRTFYLSMFSPREKHEAAIADQERLLEQAVALLADRVELKRGDDGELTDAIARIHNQAEALLLALQRAEQSIEGAGGAKSDTRAQLRDMHARLSRLTREEEQALAELKRHRAPTHNRALETGNGRHVVELERDVLQLDDLLGRQRLEELLAVGDEMTQARDRLKSLLEQYKKTRSESLRKDIERELRELERRLAELEAKASKLAGEMPDQFLNAEAMGKNDMKSELDKIREMLQRGDVEQAMAALKKMSSSLDQMVASMESDLRGFRRERFSAEEKAMAELEDKLTDLAHDEQQLKNETEQVRQRTRAEAQRLMRDKIEPVIKRAREKLAQLKKHVEQIEPGALPPYDLEELQRAKDEVDGLDKALAGSDVDEARSAARHAGQELQALDSDLKDEESRMFYGRNTRPGAKKAREHAGEGSQLAKQIADELAKAMPQPGEMMSAEDQKRMSELSQRQQATRKRTDELARELERKTGPDGKPMALPPTLGEGLKQAGQHMDRAEAELARKDARDASGEEGQALDRLNKMQEQLQRERRPREQMAGGRLDKEPVKIPGADEYRAPKEFRQDLLEAMKRAAPSEYREQVKRYYEELVK